MKKLLAFLNNRVRIKRNTDFSFYLVIRFDQFAMWLALPYLFSLFINPAVLGDAILAPRRNLWVSYQKGVIFVKWSKRYLINWDIPKFILGEMIRQYQIRGNYDVRTSDGVFTVALVLETQYRKRLPFYKKESAHQQVIASPPEFTDDMYQALGAIGTPLECEPIEVVNRYRRILRLKDELVSDLKSLR